MFLSFATSLSLMLRSQHIFSSLLAQVGESRLIVEREPESAGRAVVRVKKYLKKNNSEKKEDKFQGNREILRKTVSVDL